MPICITCSTPVKNLYTKYSKADDRSLGKGVRLTQCPNCKRFADKYVEHDYVVLFIDLVLIKPQVYRHLLFNRLWTPTNTLDPSILRLGILLILFDVYIIWARIERSNSNLTSTSPFFISPAGSNFSTAPIITQYLFFLTLNVVATLVQHGVIRGLARWFLRDGMGGSGGDGVGSVVVATGGGVGSGGSGNTSPVIVTTGAGNGVGELYHFRSSSSPSKLGTGLGGSGLGVVGSVPTTGLEESNAASRVSGSGGGGAAAGNQSMQLDGSSPSGSRAAARSGQMRPGGQASPSAISTALLVSSCTKLFPILLVIWPTNGDDESSSSALAPFANRATSYIGWVVLLNNIEALLILLDCGYVVATALAVAGLLSRWIVEGLLLSFVGLMREMEGPVGDVVSVWRWIVSAGHLA